MTAAGAGDAGRPWGACRPGAVAAALIWLSRTTLLGRGATRKLLFRAVTALHDGPFDVDLYGAHVRLHPRHNVSERKALMRPDRMDPREHGFVRAAMRVEGAVLVDVGANAGLYSLDAALHAGPRATILSIDPNPELLARLAFNLATARREGRLRPDVVTIAAPVAISDRDGTGVLTGGADEGSRTLEGTGQGQTVVLRALAGLVAEHGLARIDVMKIDVEGHEDKVLPPFLDAAPAALWPRLIVIEHLARARWAVDCIALAEAKGYGVRLTTPNNTVLEMAAPALPDGRTPDVVGS